MIKDPVALLAGSIVVDRATNNLSIFNQIDEITTLRVPLHFACALLLVFERDAEDEFDGKISLTHRLPSGKTQPVGEFIVSFMGKKRTRFILNFQGFQIEEFGTHAVAIQWLSKSGHEGKREVTFDVNAATVPTPISPE